MTSELFSSIQSLSTKFLHFIQGSPPTSHEHEAASPVREDLEKLSWMLARIQAVQQDAEEREIHDRSVQLWLAELRDVAYKAEDVLDDFYYEVLKSIVESGDAAIEPYHRDQGPNRKFADMDTSSPLPSYSFTINKASIPDGMAEKIKSITEKFEEISNDRRVLHLREEDGIRFVIGPQTQPPTSSHVDERAIFGRQEETEKIISLVNPLNGPDFMVLPIVGMGGFGKTTLAQLVYNNSRICRLFNKRCWVSVSDDFDLVRLTKAIVESVSNNPCEFSELSLLQDVLKEKIRGLRLFLVLDDVWNENRNLWECFRVGFLGAKFVRILTTTRNTSVAKIIQTTSPIILGSLHVEKCWSLFKHFAFGTSEASENANLHEIGRDIVKKCNGSPLAIKALGGILRYEIDEEKWREILESDISEIDESGEIMPALRLSYQKLPRHLKPCFLYLSMFPKGKQFGKNMVVRLWMAQGYINSDTRNLKTLEEIGNEYFDELQARSLIDYELYTKYFLHDLIHDLARSISQEEYRPVLENDQRCNDPCKVYHLYFKEQDELLGSFITPSIYWSIRTVVMECWRENFDFVIFSETACTRALHLRNYFLRSTLGMLKHLRYLSVEHSQMETVPETLCLLYNLQTLDLNIFYLKELPENIKNLINLRYFKLHSSVIQKLPESIFLLRNLHKLSLKYCTKLKKLPRGIEQLSRLRILKLPPSLIYMPSGIGKLKTLKPISGQFSVMDHSINGGLIELKDMNKLSGLLCISGLRNIGDVEYARNANLATKPNLHKLILNFHEDPIPLCWGYSVLHLHLVVHSSTIAKTKNDEKIHDLVLQSLQPHGNLTQLTILNYGGRNFPSWLLNPLLPKLTTLTLNFCTEPNFLPPFGQLPYLRFLEILGNTSVRNVGNEFGTYSLLAKYGSSQYPKEPSYPSLEVLSLRNTLNLVEWQAHDGDFPCLKKLIIENCPKLWKIAVIPQEVREVTFKNCPKLKLLACPSIINSLTIHKCGFSEIILGSIYESLMISNCMELISINWIDRGLYSIRVITLEYCPKLKLVTIPVESLIVIINRCGFREIMFQSVLDHLTISNCTELISINWMDEGLNSLRAITFECCPKLELVTIPVRTQKLKIHECGFREIMFRSVSKYLTVSNCKDLISINWMYGGINSVRDVSFRYCPKLELQFPVKDVIHSKIMSAEIYNCPRMVLSKRYVYQRDTKTKVLNLFGNNGIRMSHASLSSTIPLLENPFTLFLTKEDFLGVESLTCVPSDGVSCHHVMLNLASLVVLKIMRCRKVISMTGLDNLSNIKHLSISYCPELCNWEDKSLPQSLEFLKLNSCGKLSSLPLLSAQNNSSTLNVLSIIKCPRLAVLEGFHGLMNLKTVELLHCGHISISPATESLQLRPRITIGNCPLMRDWCQRNNIMYYEMIDNPQDDIEAEMQSDEQESDEHESGELESGEQESDEEESNEEESGEQESDELESDEQESDEEERGEQGSEEQESGGATSIVIHGNTKAHC